LGRQLVRHVQSGSERIGKTFSNGRGEATGAANVVKSFIKFISMAWSKHFSSAAPKRFSIFKYYISSWHRLSGKIITTYALTFGLVCSLSKKLLKCTNIIHFSLTSYK